MIPLNPESGKKEKKFQLLLWPSKSLDKTPFWFKIYILTWLALITASISGIMSIIGFYLVTSYRFITLFIFVIHLLILGFLGHQKVKIAAIMYFYVNSVYLILDAAIRELSPNLNILVVLLIASSFFLNSRRISILFICQILGILIITILGFLTWTPILDPTTNHYYATSITLIIPLLSLAYFLAVIIRRVFFHTLTDLLDAKNELDKIIENIVEGVILLDANYKIRFFNKKVEELTGNSLINSLNHPVFEIFDIRHSRNKNRYASLDTISQGISQTHSIQDQIIVIGKDDNEILCEYTLNPLKSQGKINGYVIVVRDVSNQQRKLEEIIKSHKIESISLLAGGIAHDFNNLLATILGNFSILQMEIADRNDLSGYLHDINIAIQKSIKLTQQLLTFSKGGALFMHKASLEEIIKETADFILRGTPITVSYQFNHKINKIKLDSNQFGQVIQNIIINSKEAIGGPGKITIQTEIISFDHHNMLDLNPGAYIEIKISDSGPGIPPENIPKLFEPYFTTKESGNGLGLSICLSIMKKHGGTLQLEQSINVGACFILYLPVKS